VLGATAALFAAVLVFARLQTTQPWHPSFNLKFEITKFEILQEFYGLPASGKYMAL